jgi:hypothetical protein
LAGDLLYLPAYRVRGDPEPLQRLDRHAVTAAGQAEQEVLGAAGMVEPAAYVLLLRTGRLPAIETFGTPGRGPPYFYENFMGLLPPISQGRVRGQEKLFATSFAMVPIS